MRGLLWVVGLAIATLVVLVVIGVQVVVPAVVAAAVRSSSAFAGQPISVQVQTSLAGVLLHGWIDRVSVTGAGLRVADIDVGRLDLTATEVEIVNRTFTDLQGTVTGVTTTTLAGTTVRLDSVTVSGSSNEVAVTGTLGPSTLEAALATELRPLGLAASQIRLVNGAIRVDLAGRTDVATLRLDGTTLVLVPGLGLAPIPLLRSPADGTWELTNVAVSATGATVTAIGDLSKLAFGG